MCISFEKIMHIGEKIESGVKDDDGEKGVPEIDGALFYLVFAPVSGGGKENMSQDMGASRLVGMDENGKLVSQLDFSAPTSGWNIMNMIKSPYANDYYLFGPAKDEVYVNKIAKVISPLDYNQAVNDIKFKNYQVMKISDGKVVYVNSTPLESFETQASSPPSQKSIPEYEGKNFNRRIEFITKDGEILLAGQNFQEKNKEDDAGNKWVETKYQDLILVHFDTAGKLKRSYGVKRDNMNKYSKASVTPMEIYLSPNGKNLYWVYGEIEGMRKDWGFGEKLLYFPAVAKVDLENATISDFTYMGADAEGKQRFYTHPAVDQILSEDGKKMIFVGEDKKGTLIWLAKMNVM
jgi:hypothetical protein